MLSKNWIPEIWEKENETTALRLVQTILGLKLHKQEDKGMERRDEPLCEMEPGMNKPSALMATRRLLNQALDEMRLIEKHRDEVEAKLKWQAANMATMREHHEATNRTVTQEAERIMEAQLAIRELWGVVLARKATKKVSDKTAALCRFLMPVVLLALVVLTGCARQPEPTANWVACVQAGNEYLMLAGKADDKDSAAKFALQQVAMRREGKRITLRGIVYLPEVTAAPVNPAEQAPKGSGWRWEIYIAGMFGGLAFLFSSLFAWVAWTQKREEERMAGITRGIAKSAWDRATDRALEDDRSMRLNEKSTEKGDGEIKAI